MYVVRCADGSLYAAAASDVESATAALNGGNGSAWLRARLPVFVMHVEEYMNEQDAARRAAAFMRMRHAARERSVGMVEQAAVGSPAFAS